MFYEIFNDARSKNEIHWIKKHHFRVKIQIVKLVVNFSHCPFHPGYTLF